MALIGNMPSIGYTLLGEDVIFKTRVRDESVGGGNPYRWQDVTINDIFEKKNVLIVTLPGAFTPTCTTRQVPAFEEMYDEIKEMGKLDEIYIMAVNDAFVMNAWAKSLKLEKLKMLPDGNYSLTRRLRLDYGMYREGMGVRCRRSALFFSNGKLFERWVEDVPDPSSDDPAKQDPYENSAPEKVIQYFTVAKEVAENKKVLAAAE
tara:strand:+ start:180 stop:794 length:615 start_codon:yes stop_codon:yes gene_type:complete